MSRHCDRWLLSLKILHPSRSWCQASHLWGAAIQSSNRFSSFLTSAFKEATRQESTVGYDYVVDRRRELEAKGQLSADQVAKLAQSLASTVSDYSRFWEALGKRLAEMPKSLTAAGHASLDAAFPGGRGPEFDSKSKMLRAVDAARTAKERGARDAVDMTVREKAALKQRDYERREEEHKKLMDREADAEEKARQKERERAMQRTRGGRSPSRKRSSSRRRSPSRKKQSPSRRRSPSKRRSPSRRDRERDRKPPKRSRSRSRDRGGYGRRR